MLVQSLTEQSPFLARLLAFEECMRVARKSRFWKPQLMLDRFTVRRRSISRLQRFCFERPISDIFSWRAVSTISLSLSTYTPPIRSSRRSYSAWSRLITSSCLHLGPAWLWRAAHQIPLRGRRHKSAGSQNFGEFGFQHLLSNKPCDPTSCSTDDQPFAILLGRATQRSCLHGPAVSIF